MIKSYRTVCPEFVRGEWLLWASTLLLTTVSTWAPTNQLASGSLTDNSDNTDYLGQILPGTVPDRFASDVIRSDGAIHGSIAFSPDASEIYWTLWASDFLDNPPRIMCVKRTEGGWSQPAAVSVCDNYGAGEISISPTGDRVSFSSRRPLPPNWGYQLQPQTREWGVGKIWCSDRNVGTWGNPEILEKSINQDLNGVAATAYS